jgi:hypothetical protein
LVSPGILLRTWSITILFGWKVMAAEVKEVVEPFVGGQETLCLSD